jgi:MOSC domain-containing protein YiiM
MSIKPDIKVLMDTLPQVGRTEWIGVRPSRNDPMVALEDVQVSVNGLVGDRYSGHSKRTRQVTIIQFEHLPVIASCLHRDFISPTEVRRNIVVSSINLLALKNKNFRLGNAVLEFTGLCHPCSKMESRLGTGGFNAMRGHGGITARVIKPGKVNLGDNVIVLDHQEDQGELF